MSRDLSRSISSSQLQPRSPGKVTRLSPTAPQQQQQQSASAVRVVGKAETKYPNLNQQDAHKINDREKQKKYQTGPFWRLENKSFHLTPRSMRFCTFFLEM